MEINKCYNENCLDTMARMPDGFVDLTVTSPPYDDLRTYNGYCFDFENVAKELFRVRIKSTLPSGISFIRSKQSPNIKFIIFTCNLTPASTATSTQPLVNANQ